MHFNNNHKIERDKYLVLAVELLLLIIVIHLFRIEESRGFLPISILIFVGFLIHSLLPFNYRCWFFLVLSLVGILYLFGFSNGIWLIGIGLLLIALCHLPISIRLRLTIVILTGVFLAGMRLNWIDNSLPAVIWPILGSMFMFRLIIYLYDLRHEKTKIPLSQRLSYFFLLPNVCFPLFPIVDYTKFRQTYYNNDPYRIYQVGIQRIIRGITHLILYRIVYDNLVLEPSDVQDVVALLQFLFSGFLLYLRVSGQFHLIIGILQLFGFNLPETTHLYYLASNFNEFWHRINIYWKDFMLKIVFNPIFTRLRSQGNGLAFVVATLFVFLCSWLLYSYQTFWLRASFPITWQDGIFWLLLGVLVVANSFYNFRRSTKLAQSNDPRNIRQAIILSIRIVCMFIFMSILWSFWTCSSVSEWTSVWSVISNKNSLRSIAQFASVLFILWSVVTIWILIRLEIDGRRILRKERISCSFSKTVVITCTSIISICLLGLVPFIGKTESKLGNMIVSMQKREFNTEENPRLLLGYYEQLLDVNQFDHPHWEMRVKNPGDWCSIRKTGITQYIQNLLVYKLLPQVDITFKGAMLQTNRWGMRDQDYIPEKSKDTYRIALIGGSEAMGSGVENHQTFEALLEKRLNPDNSGEQFLITISETGTVKWRQPSRKNINERYTKYEILNFACAGYLPIQRGVMLERKVFFFEPDAVFYIANRNEAQGVIDQLASAMYLSNDIPNEYLMNIIARAEIAGEMPKSLMKKRLHPFGHEIVSWVYKGIVELCRSRNIVPIWIYLPGIDEKYDFYNYREEINHCVKLAREAGFITVNLTGVYRKHTPGSLRLADWDELPNTIAHELISERLYQKLLKLGLKASSSNGPLSTQNIRNSDNHKQQSVLRLSKNNLLKQDNKTKMPYHVQQYFNQKDIRQKIWSLNVHKDNNANLEFPPGNQDLVRVNIKKAGTKERWGIQLNQPHLSVKANHHYVITFQARAYKARDIVFGFAMNHPPWNGLGLYQVVQLTSEWQCFKAEFVATANENNARIHFDVGNSNISVELSDVTMRNSLAKPNSANL